MERSWAALLSTAIAPAQFATLSRAASCRLTTDTILGGYIGHCTRRETRREEYFSCHIPPRDLDAP